MEEGSNTSYVKESIYVLQYPEEKLVSYGIINNIMEDKKYDFSHLCSTDKGSSGSPIINIKNNKVIGIHKGAENEYNRGLFLNYPIKEFINKYNNNKNIIKVNYKNNNYLQERKFSIEPKRNKLNSDFNIWYNNQIKIKI